MGIRDLKINDSLNDKINEVDVFSRPLTEKIELLYEARVDLADMLSSALSQGSLFDQVRTDLTMIPEFPIVYFTIRDTSGNDMAPSSLIIKTNGQIANSISAPYQKRDIVLKQIRNLVKSSQIQNKISEIRDIANSVEMMIDRGE
jgi:hypothetical protein